MKETKKAILEILKKNSKKHSKFEDTVLNLALQKISSENFEFDGKSVYSADGKRMIYCMDEGPSFTIPDGVEVIGEKAFCNKKNLKAVEIPSSVTVIEKDAFYDCDALEEVDLPVSVDRVEAYAFAECDNLKKVNFAGVPEHLNRHAFEDCDRLHSIIVPQGEMKRFRKALHFDDGDMDFIVVERGMDITAPLQEKKGDKVSDAPKTERKRKSDGKKSGSKPKGKNADEKGGKV